MGAVVTPTMTIPDQNFLRDLHGNTGFGKVGQALFDADCEKYTQAGGAELEVQGIPTDAERAQSLTDAISFVSNGAGRVFKEYRWSIFPKSRAIKDAHRTLFRDVSQDDLTSDQLKTALSNYSQTMTALKVSMKGTKFAFFDTIQANLKVANSDKDTVYKAPERADVKKHERNAGTDDARQYTSARKLARASAQTEGATEYTTKIKRHGWFASSTSRVTKGFTFYGVGQVINQGFNRIGTFVNGKLNGIGEQSNGQGYAIGAFVGTTECQSDGREGLNGWGVRKDVTNFEIGNFKNFMLHGKSGKRENAYGTQVGTFENGKLVRGTYKDASGIKYIGTFTHENNIPTLDKNGIMIMPDGRRYEGEFENGELKDGTILYTDTNNNKSKGTYTAGVLNGNFTFVSGLGGNAEDAGTIQNGVWVKAQ